MWCGVVVGRRTGSRRRRRRRTEEGRKEEEEGGGRRSFAAILDQAIFVSSGTCTFPFRFRHGGYEGTRHGADGRQYVSDRDLAAPYLAEPLKSS